MYAKVPLYFWAPLRRWWLYRDLVQFGHNFEQSCLPPMICPWSACDRPYIYRGPRWKCAKNFVLVKIFRFCKNSEKAPKTNEKCSFLILFCLRKNVFFIEQRPQKCIQKCEIFPNFIWSAETWPVHLRRTWPLTFPYLKIAFSLFGGLRTGNFFILP